MLGFRYCGEVSRQALVPDVKTLVQPTLLYPWVFIRTHSSVAALPVTPIMLEAPLTAIHRDTGCNQRDTGDLTEPLLEF